MKKYFVIFTLISLSVILGIDNIKALTPEDSAYVYTEQDVEYMFTRMPYPTSSYGAGNINKILNDFIPNELWKQYGEYYLCDLDYGGRTNDCYIFDDYSQISIEYSFHYMFTKITIEAPYTRYRYNEGSFAGTSVLQNNVQTSKALYLYMKENEGVALRSNVSARYVATGEMPLTDPLILQREYDTDDYYGLYFEKVGSTREDIQYDFRIEFESNNGIFPEYLYEYYTRGVRDSQYELGDLSYSGLTWDGCTVSGSKQVCTGSIDLSDYDLHYPSDFYFKWQFLASNFSSLDGTFKIYTIDSNLLAIGGLENITYGLYKYTLSTGSNRDFIISPGNNIDYWFYYSGYNKVRFYKYDNATKYVVEEYMKTDVDYLWISGGFHTKLSENEYVRILLEPDTNYIFYADRDDLLFSPVVSGNAIVVDENGDTQTVEFGYDGLEDLFDNESDSISIVGLIKRSWNFFYKIMSFIVNLMTSFYNIMPISFQYFIILSFLISIVFIIIHFV